MRPVLVTGAGGAIGSATARLCAERGLAVHALGRAELDVTDAAAVTAVFEETDPWLVVNAAGYARVNAAEGDAERCRHANAIGAEVLAQRAAVHGIPLVTFSSHLVFGGDKGGLYEEDDSPAPLGVYGRTKLEAELRVLGANPHALVLRTSACFSPWNPGDFLAGALAELAAGRAVRCAGDLTLSPTYIPDLVHAALDLAIDGESGVWHLATPGSVTAAELVRRAASGCGAPTERLEGVPHRTLGGRARRPTNSALGSMRGALLPPLDRALERYHQVRGEGPR